MALAVLCCMVQAQNMPALPSCAQPDSNFIRFPGGTSAEIDRLVARLDSVLLFEKGRVNIVHIGGSHVQADIYTNIIRTNIDSLNRNLRPPRGFIFPFSVAKTNNPWNYRVRHGGQWSSARNALRQFYPPLGVGGIAAYTSDPEAWFGVELNTDTTHRWQSTHIHLLGESLHGHSVPRLMVNDSIVIEPEKEPTGYNYTLGESAERFSVGFVFDSLTAQPPDTFVVRGLVVDNDDPGIVFHSIGVNGASVPSYLGCSKFRSELELIKPDLVIFAIGINDATAHDFSDSTFVANYDMLIRDIRSVAPQCAFIFISNNDSYTRVSRRRYRVNPRGLIAQKGFKTLAQKWQGGLWDLFEIMGGLESMQEWNNQKLARNDKVHFTAQGYNVVGRLFTEAFFDFYLSYDYTADVY